MKRFLPFLFALLLTAGCSAGETPGEDPQDLQEEAPVPSQEASSQPLSPELEAVLEEELSILGSYCLDEMMIASDHTSSLPAYAVGVYNAAGLEGEPDVDSQEWADFCQDVNGLYFGGRNRDILRDYSSEPYWPGVGFEVKSASLLGNGMVEAVVSWLDLQTPGFDPEDFRDMRFLLSPVTVEGTFSNPLSAQAMPRGKTVLRFVRGEILPVEYENPQTVELSTPEDLISLSREAASGDGQYQGNTYILTSDIDLAGVELEPIGLREDYHARRPWEFLLNALPGFNAAFDGGGHTVRNWSYSTAGGDSGGLPAGFFSAIGPYGTVENLNLENCSVAVVPPSADYADGAGGFCGVLYNGGVIRGCSFSGSVEGVWGVGGLVGSSGYFHPLSDLQGTVENCRVDAQVTASGTAGVFAGGLSYVDRVDGCSARGNVTVRTDIVMDHLTVGGFVGELGSNVTNCHSEAAVDYAYGPNRMGSFAGELTDCSITGCTIAEEALHEGWYLVGYQHYQDSLIDITTVPGTESPESAANSEGSGTGKTA